MSDDLTYGLARRVLDDHPAVDKRCSRCGEAWPCEAAQLADDTIAKVLQHRADRSRNGLA